MKKRIHAPAFQAGVEDSPPVTSQSRDRTSLSPASAPAYTGRV